MSFQRQYVGTVTLGRFLDSISEKNSLISSSRTTFLFSANFCRYCMSRSFILLYSANTQL